MRRRSLRYLQSRVITRTVRCYRCNIPVRAWNLRCRRCEAIERFRRSNIASRDRRYVADPAGASPKQRQRGRLIISRVWSG